MITRSLPLARIPLVALMLTAVFTSLALAQRGPMSVDRLSGDCAPATSVDEAQPDLDPLGLTTPEPTPQGCYYGMYDEWWKNGEICRWRNSCDGPNYHGSCPDGYDFRVSETVICYCW